MSARLTLIVVGILAIAGILWAAYSAGVSSGVDRERAKWERASAAAEASSREREQAGTVASEEARDAAAVAAQEASDETRGQTATTIETIRYVYRTQPAPACAPDPVPDGVRDALSAAYDAAAAASGRLPAAAGPGA